MKRFLFNWLAMTLAVLATSYILKGVVINHWVTAAIAALVLGLVNAVVRPILVILTLPFTILSMGLFLIILNAGLLMFTAWLIDGFFIVNLWWAIGGSLLISIINSFISGMAKKD